MKKVLIFTAMIVSLFAVSCTNVPTESVEASIDSCITADTTVSVIDTTAVDTTVKAVK